MFHELLLMIRYWECTMLQWCVLLLLVIATRKKEKQMTIVLHFRMDCMYIKVYFASQKRKRKRKMVLIYISVFSSLIFSPIFFDQHILHSAVETIPVYLAMIHDVIAVHYMVVDILHSFIYVIILTTLTVWSKLFTNFILNKKINLIMLSFNPISLLWSKMYITHGIKLTLFIQMWMYRS